MTQNAIPPCYDFADTGVVIAGGTSGVGLATALAFAAAGARRIVLLGRDAERGKRAVEQVAAAHPTATPTFVSADANDPVAAEGAAAEAAAYLGRIDVLVNSTVAPYQPTLLHDIPTGQLVQILLQQAAGPLLMSRAVLPYMRAQNSGAIINIASDAVKVPTPGETAIGAAMAAIVTFSRTLALEAKRYGVTVNAITPSLIVNTGSYDRAMNLEFSKKIFDKIVSQAHLGLTEPEDLANLIVFLASPMGRKITGQVVSVNGGISVA
jgi:NAD(P)-dependent dehydrogenase (short-subunit alcohol dehydrogenase family)